MYTMENTAQNGTVGGTGNTKCPASKRQRSRAWFFTWNNPKEGFAAQLGQYFEELDCDYVFQLEKVTTEHIQGVFRFKNPRDFSAVKAILGDEPHIERCRSWRKALRYCSKLESRIEGPWTNVMGLKYRETIRDVIAEKGAKDWQKQVIDIVWIVTGKQ